VVVRRERNNGTVKANVHEKAWRGYSSFEHHIIFSKIKSKKRIQVVRALVKKKVERKKRC